MCICQISQAAFVPEQSSYVCSLGLLSWTQEANQHCRLDTKTNHTAKILWWRCINLAQMVGFNRGVVRRWLQSGSCVRIPFSFSIWSIAWAGHPLLLTCSISAMVKERRGAIEAHLSLMALASCWRVSSSSSWLGSNSLLWKSTSEGENHTNKLMHTNSVQGVAS